MSGSSLQGKKSGGWEKFSTDVKHLASAGLRGTMPIIMQKSSPSLFLTISF